MLKLEEHIQHPYTMLLEANIIIIGSVADLSSVGTKIAVEKDWVVVIAGSDKSLLASKYAGSGQLNIWISMITTCCISAEKGIFVNFFLKEIWDWAPRGCCIVFYGKILCTHSTSFHPYSIINGFQQTVQKS